MKNRTSPHTPFTPHPTTPPPIFCIIRPSTEPWVFPPKTQRHDTHNEAPHPNPSPSSLCRQNMVREAEMISFLQVYHHATMVFSHPCCESSTMTLNRCRESSSWIVVVNRRWQRCCPHFCIDATMTMFSRVCRESSSSSWIIRQNWGRVPMSENYIIFENILGESADEVRLLFFR